MTDPVRWSQHPPPNSRPEPSGDQPPLRPLQPSPYPHLNYPMYQQPQIPSPQQYQRPIMQDVDRNDQKRTRISRACDTCRRKKIKCDTKGQGEPCKNCKTSKSDCTFNDSAKKRGPPKGYIEVLENRLKRMERILGSLGDADHIKAEPVDDEDEDIDDEDNTQIDEQTTNKLENDNTRMTLPEKVTPTLAGATPEQQQQQKALSFELSSLNTNMRARYIGDMSPLPLLAQKINFEDARIASQIGIRIRRFGQSLVWFEPTDTSGKGANQLLLEDLGMIRPGDTIKGLNDWIYRVAGIDKSTSDILMKIFFTYIHPGLPVVNKQLFLKQYRGEIPDYPSAPLLNSIYGSAVRYIETCKMFGDDALADFGEKLDVPEGWSEKLFENLLVYVKGRYRPCISTVQALIIAQNHRASLDEKVTSAWLLNSAAIRMAQDLGLHRASEGWDIPESEKETRRRVWWLVYIMDKWSSAATGRPQTIFDEDCDEVYPKEGASWDEVMDVTQDTVRFPSLDKTVAQKAKNENIPIYQPFVQLVKLSEILGKILQGLYTPRAKTHSSKHGSDAIVTYLDNALSEWRSALPPALQISSINVRRLDSRGQTPLLSMSGLMYLSYCTLLILLHRPFIEKDGGQKQTRSSQSSLSICTSAATRCVDIAEKMHHRDFLLVSWNFAIYPVFTASLVHIHNASNPDNIVSDVAKSNLVKAMRVIKRLAMISNGAGNLYNILQQLIKQSNISVPDFSPDDDEEQIHEEIIDTNKKNSNRNNKPIMKISTAIQQTNSSPRKAASRSRNEINSPEFKGKLSDVGRGGTPRGSCSPSTHILSDSEMINSATSTPTSVGNGDWINGLYSSLQTEPMTQNPSGSSTNSLEADPYSLRQFGFMNNGSNSNYSSLEQMPNALMPNNSNNNTSNTSYPTTTTTTTATSSIPNQSIHSMQLPLHPADSFLFGLPETPMFSSTSSSTMASSIPMYANPLSSNQYIPHDNSSVMDQTSVFRNRPDNPFWSVPSSIELDDWTAYLLPQQLNLPDSQAGNWNNLM